MSSYCLSNYNDDSLNHFSDISVQEEELKKLNSELDSKLERSGLNNCHDGFTISPSDDIKASSTKHKDVKVRSMYRSVALNNVEDDFDPTSSQHQDYQIFKKSVFHHRQPSDLDDLVTPSSPESDQINLLFDSEKNAKTCIKHSSSGQKEQDISSSKSNSVQDNGIVSPQSISSIFQSTTATLSTTSNGQTKDAIVTEIDTSSANATIGHNASSRIHQARIKALSSKLKETLSSKKEEEKKLREVRIELKEMKDAKNKVEKELACVKSKAIKRSYLRDGVTKDSISMKNDTIENLTAENQSLKKSVIGLEQVIKECESKSRAREVRLTRALESVTKYKKILNDGKAGKDELNVKLKKEKDDLIRQIKVVEKQRDDLYIVFQKQMKLIHILKRQKIHAEASKLLDITEREFCKVLDWGETS